MGKDKKRINDGDEKKVSLFYYEMIGVVLIIFSITILGKLGTIGNILTKVFKVAFGDWYWLLILLLLFIGLYYLFMHQKFSLKNQKFVGFIFLYITLIMFAHFAIHDFVSTYKGNYFVNTWSVYKGYINGKAINTLGGGIVGAAIFYAVFFLLGKVGVIVVGLLVIALSFSLVINKPIIDIFKYTITKAKNIKKYTGSFNHFFKYELGKDKQKEKRNIFTVNKRLKVKSLEQYDNKYALSKIEKKALENKQNIVTVLKNMDINYSALDIITSYKITTYRFTIYVSFDVTLLLEKLDAVFDVDIMYSYKNNILSLQLENEEKLVLTTNELILKQDNFLDNYIMPLGIDYCNNIVEIDTSITKSSHLLISGANEEVINFINSFLLMLFCKKRLVEFEVVIYDNHHHFENYDMVMTIETGDLIEYLENIKEELNNRIKEMNKHKCYTYNEYVYALSSNDDVTLLKRKFIIIDMLDITINNDQVKAIENRLFYINQIASKSGVNIILLINNEQQINSLICSIFPERLIYKVCSEALSQTLIGNSNCFYLKGDGDAYYITNTKYRRLITPQVCNSTFLNTIASI